MDRKNYIAYSLWGEQPIYIIGMLKNIKQAKNIYPGWQVIVYHDNTAPQQIITDMQTAGAETVNIDNGTYGMFWRFYAADIADCNYVIFRDSDSRLSAREKAAVDDWIKSGDAIHIMRDHPYHQHLINNTAYHILGGMWGIKGNLVNMTDMVNQYALGKTLTYGSDQFFLNRIYEQFKNSATIHDEFYSGSKFPVKRKNYRFIGESFNENDQPNNDAWKVIRDYYRDKTFYWPIIKALKNTVKRIIK